MPHRDFPLNKKYLTALIILAAFLLMCLLGTKCFLDTEFFLPSAWGEQNTEGTEKWKELVENASQQGISAEDLNRIQDVLRSAEINGFPIEPLLNKAMEGMAKGISPSTIVNVLELRLENLYTCEKMLGKMKNAGTESPSEKNELLIVMSESMARGVSKEEMEALATHAPKPLHVHLANASQDAATFKDLGFSSENAMEIVLTGLQNGIYIERSRGISAAVREARRNGMTNEELKNVFLSNIRQGKGMKEIFQGKSDKGYSRPQSRGSGNTSRGGPRFRNRH
ncbi:MAG: hypothetical protein ACMUIU_07950 [bacterium]